MDIRFRIGLATAIAAICTVPLVSQQAGRIVKVPFERGVYFEGPSGWISLPNAVFLPQLGSGVKELLGVGSRVAVATMPGAHAAVTITNRKPSFYIRGYRPGTRIYLARGTEKGDARQVRLSMSGDISEGARFHASDLTDIEMEHAGTDLVIVRPRADLRPGEYVLVSTLEPRYRAIRMGFEFSVAGATTGP
jgi:hypothetical protein